METDGHPPTRPLDPSEIETITDDPPTRRSPGRIARNCVLSLAVMAPWPLLGVLGTYRFFEHSWEAVLLFGGITGIPLALLTVVGMPAAALEWLIVIAWLAAAIVPDVWLDRRMTSRTSVGWLFGIQSAFSFAQAAMGALMVLGKSV